MHPKTAYSKGFSYALRAAELDDTMAEAHVVLAEYHKQLDYNWPAAEREMARALELNRASPFVRLRHAILVGFERRFRIVGAGIARNTTIDQLRIDLARNGQELRLCRHDKAEAEAINPPPTPSLEKSNQKGQKGTDGFKPSEAAGHVMEHLNMAGILNRMVIEEVILIPKRSLGLGLEPDYP